MNLRLGLAVRAVVLLFLGSRLALAGVTTIYSDNFAADPLGSVPVTPVVGQPWQTSATSPGGIKIVLDPYFSGNGLQLGPYRSTVVMPFSTAAQTVMAGNQNFTLSFQYHDVSSNSFTPYLDISGDDTTTGDPAFLFRIMSRPTTPASGLHEIYYLNKTTGLTDSGLAVPANSLQILTVAADFAGQTSQLSVGANTATLPLYMCPSMIQDVTLSSYMIGSGGPSYTDIGQITATTNGADPNVQDQAFRSGSPISTPEPSAAAHPAAGCRGSGSLVAVAKARVRGGRVEAVMNLHAGHEQGTFLRRHRFVSAHDCGLWLLGLSAVSIVISTSATHGTSYSWQVPGGDWSIASNWGGTLPTGSEFAYVVNGGTVNVTQPSETCGTLSLGSSAGSGTVQMTGGSLYGIPYQYVGYSGTGTFLQTGGTNAAYTNLYLGYNIGSSGTYIFGTRNHHGEPRLRKRLRRLLWNRGVRTDRRELLRHIEPYPWPVWQRFLCLELRIPERV